jgi:hypothetical protein
MAAILRLPAAPTGPQARTRFAARVTDISEWLGCIRCKDELKGFLIVGVSDRWHQEVQPYALTYAKLRPKDCHLDEGIWTNEFADIPMIMTTVPEARADRVAATGAQVP